MPESRTHSRKRGVRASREKLTQALVAKGLRTQTALAELIADLEELETAPVKMVNRVFAEASVDVQTLARVARALDVEAHTLYKSLDETSPRENNTLPRPPGTPTHASASENEPSPSNDPMPQEKSTPGWVYAAFLTGIALLGFWLYSPRSETTNASTAQVAADSRLSLGESSVAVLPFKNDENEALADMVRTKLDSRYSVASKTAIAVLKSGDAYDAVETLRVDAAIEGDIVSVGLYSGVRVYMLVDGIRKPVWAESTLTTQLPNQLQAISERIADAVTRTLNPSQVKGDKPFFPSAATQNDFLEGHSHLLGDATELTLRRAQSRFSSAIRKEPNYARAHAGLCLALLEGFWMSDEERALNEAADTCGIAVGLAPQDSVVVQAQALFLRRSGRNQEALTLYESLTQREPDNPLVLENMASSLLDAYRQSGEQHYLDSAIVAAKQANTADPNLLEPLTTLVVLQWFAKDIQGAIDASIAALDIKETSGALMNLGTLQLCVGQFDEALSTYQRASQLSPESTKYAEFEGQAYYFMGDFKRSANLRNFAIESIASGSPEVHEMWGNLGDSYRQLDDGSNATRAYLEAARIIERDDLRGNSALSDRVARAYYYLTMHELDRESVPDSVLTTINSQLEEMNSGVTDTTALRRMTQIWLTKNEPEKAQASFKKMNATCPGYARIPDFQALSDFSSKPDSTQLD
ncbi:MAG: hypothetical protein AB8G18_18745 [Gammaproteobacteria bacterium]